jgi:hypothetical protein
LPTAPYRWRAIEEDIVVPPGLDEGEATMNFRPQQPKTILVCALDDDGTFPAVLDEGEWRIDVGTLSDLARIPIWAFGDDQLSKKKRAQIFVVT